VRPDVSFLSGTDFLVTYVLGGVTGIVEMSKIGLTASLMSEASGGQ
jgi:hypothetical protein